MTQSHTITPSFEPDYLNDIIFYKTKDAHDQGTN